MNVSCHYKKCKFQSYEDAALWTCCLFRKKFLSQDIVYEVNVEMAYLVL